MFEQFQQSMLMMMKMFGQMQQQQMAGIQQEMARLASLTEEMHKIQSDLARGVAPAPAVAHHNPLPAPDDVPAVNKETANRAQFVFDRIAKMEAENGNDLETSRGHDGPEVGVGPKPPHLTVCPPSGYPISLTPAPPFPRRARFQCDD